MPENSAPRVILVVTIYNQAEFVREAVESALAQDYSPLEILFTDDCSDDGTWDIVTDAVAGYNGPHRIQLNRNGRRLVNDHRYHYLELAGEGLFVLGHGDDVFMPHRVSRLVERHMRTGALAIASPAHKIDRNGRRIGEHPPPHIRELDGDCSLEAFMKARITPTCFGAGLAWHTDLMKMFGPPPRGPRNLDELIPFRAALLDKADYVREPLLYWRRHGGNMTLQFQRAETEIDALLIEERKIQNKIANWTCFIQDTFRAVELGADPQRMATARMTFMNYLLVFASKHMEIRHQLAGLGWGIA